MLHLVYITVVCNHQVQGKIRAPNYNAEMSFKLVKLLFFKVIIIDEMDATSNKPFHKFTYNAC